VVFSTANAENARKPAVHARPHSLTTDETRKADRGVYHAATMASARFAKPTYQSQIAPRAKVVLIYNQSEQHFEAAIEVTALVAG
jgi:hypothetical protein